jgi:diaminopimelate epimerase
MIFYKTDCSGNDFIHIDLGDTDLIQDWQKSNLARRICNRNSGAGADGVVFYRIHKEFVDFEIFNQDGSRAELSGNGMAGLATVLFHLKRFRNRITLNTQVGRRTVELIEESGNVLKLRIEIGVPDFEKKDFFPFLEPDQLQYRYGNVDFFPVSVGNPHAVVFLADTFSENELLSMGMNLAEAPIFPHGTNVELVDPETEESIRVFFYERGVGRTQFSSTGSSAVFAVMRRLNKIRTTLSIRTPVENVILSGTEEIFLENFCEMVYNGIYEK